MPESVFLNQPLVNTGTIATPNPYILTKDLPTPDTDMMATHSPNTPTRRLPKRESPTSDQKASIGISSQSEPEDLDQLTPKQEKLRKLLQQRYVTIGGILTAFDPYGGMVIIQKSEERSMETVKAARHNKKLWDALEKIVQGGDGFAFFIGHGLMIFALLVHAKRIKSTPQIDAVLAMSGYSEEFILMNAVLHDAETRQSVSGSNGN